MWDDALTGPFGLIAEYSLLKVSIVELLHDQTNKVHVKFLNIKTKIAVIVLKFDQCDSAIE